MTQDKEREERIHMEIVVDAYDEEERAMGWYYYLKEKLQTPFEARCSVTRSISPLKKGEKIKVQKLAPLEDCQHEIFVMIQRKEDYFGVPLTQLTPFKADAETEEAVADWHYWVQEGYCY